MMQLPTPSSPAPPHSGHLPTLWSVRGPSTGRGKSSLPAEPRPTKLNRPKVAIESQQTSNICTRSSERDAARCRWRRCVNEEGVVQELKLLPSANSVCRANMTSGVAGDSSKVPSGGGESKQVTMDKQT